MLLEVFIQRIKASPAKELSEGIFITIAGGEVSAILLPQLADSYGHSALKFGVSLVCNI